MIELSNCLWVPLSELLPGELPELKKKLTAKVVDLTGETVKVLCMREDREGYVGLPRVQGLKLISPGRYADRRTRGQLVKFPRKVALRDYQVDTVEEILDACETSTDFMVCAATGKGKCLARGTPVLMYDGSVRPVEHIAVGDSLMGPDSTPRKVLSLASGREEMFCVTPSKGESYTVNRSHILSLRITGLSGKTVTAGDGRVYRGGDIVDISIDDYLQSSTTFKHVAKGWRTGVEFPTQRQGLPLPPYFLGLWLGDGLSRGPSICTADQEIRDEVAAVAAHYGLRVREEVQHGNASVVLHMSGEKFETNPVREKLQFLSLLENKHIPKCYRVASRADRLSLLAGLLDTDGSAEGSGFVILQKNEQLAIDIAFVARSLGFGCTIRSVQKKCHNNGAVGTYFRVNIFGNCQEIPVRLPRRKVAQRSNFKDPTSVGISVTSVGDGDYFGFEIDGDRRFLLGDFTVTHNTVMGLSVIQTRARTAVVLVDQDNLLTQWMDRCVEHLGMAREDIGVVQGKKKDWRGKKIVICMVQTLVSASNNLPEEFYKNFGTAIFDESHSMGARTYSQALMMFHAEVRFGLSATPKRPDRFMKLLDWNLGTIDVILQDKLEASSVYILQSHGVYSWASNNAKIASRFINEIADDGARNLLIVNAIKWLYESGRDILVVSDRVEHLCSLISLCRAIGLPDQDLGLYAKTETVWLYEKDPRPARRPYGWEKGTEYTPIRLALVQKTIPKVRREAAKENARVIFATYGIIAKGVDIPRLSGGIDATPRAKATQVLGRILRIFPGKIRPIWVTIADTNSFRSLFQLLCRIRDYITSNAEIFIWHPSKGRKLQDADELQDELQEQVSLLRRSKIVIGLDGNNTLWTPSTQSARNSLPARRTTGTSR